MLAECPRIRLVSAVRIVAPGSSPDFALAQELAWANGGASFAESSAQNNWVAQPNSMLTFAIGSPWIAEHVAGHIVTEVGATLSS